MNTENEEIVRNFCMEADGPAENIQLDTYKARQICRFIDSLQNRLIELDKRVTKYDRRKIEFDALLKEVQNADNLVENHSRISVAISTGLLVAALSEFVKVWWPLAILGIFVGVIWTLKIRRHKEIFDNCIGKLYKIQKKLGINAIRPRPENIRSHGFSLMYFLSMGFIVLWILLLVSELLYFSGCIATDPRSFLIMQSRQQEVASLKTDKDRKESLNSTSRGYKEDRNIDNKADEVQPYLVLSVDQMQRYNSRIIEEISESTRTINKHLDRHLRIINSKIRNAAHSNNN